MDEKIKTLVKEAIASLIQNTVCEKKRKHIAARHEKKIHFVPIRYRVLGGLLQSLNIQFGNYVETLIHLIVKNEPHLEVISEVSGQKKVKLPLSEQTEAAIDRYVAQCQAAGLEGLEQRFADLQQQITQMEAQTPGHSQTHDVDVLFRDRRDGKYYYLEVKYNDDHDTGKYMDINRKFIKTFAGLVNYLRIRSVQDLKPILYYLNDRILKGNIYIPERTHIYRGPKLFTEFFAINYLDLDRYLKEIGDDPEILAIFDDLYQRIRHGIVPDDLC